ncbi:MAG: OmpA family protein [Cardiobacteriaceae bacterium]|nr:OmpA family protein [Cardiobacteriaceae bacterium]
MKLNKIIAVAALAFGGVAFAQANENLTDNSGILVKNNYGECVTVLANKGLTGCGAQAPTQAPAAPAEVVTETVTASADAYFDFDKSNLKPAGKQSIQELAAQLKQPNVQLQGIEVVGHTDSKGSDSYNQALSERRALAVGNELVANGIPASMIVARGEGERNPRATNNTAEGRAQNRRVDITIQATVQR